MIDQVDLNFNPSTLVALNIILGFILFGVALELKVADFKRIATMKKEVLVGITAQMILLPLVTAILIFFLNPEPSFALGMILVASCPGGNLSNFLTHHAKGNAALSVTLTTLATLLAIIFTPLNFAFYGNLLPSTQELVQSIKIPVFSMMLNIVALILIPLVLGLYISTKHSAFAKKISKCMKVFSLIFFGLFILLALKNNWSNFIQFLPAIFGLVFLHNLIAFATGYTWSSLFKVQPKEKKAITLEVGLQNSGLGLILIFNFFGGMGGMALIAAFWGIWHIVSGLTLSTIFSKQIDS